MLYVKHESPSRAHVSQGLMLGKLLEHNERQWKGAATSRVTVNISGPYSPHLAFAMSYLRSFPRQGGLDSCQTLDPFNSLRDSKSQGHGERPMHIDALSMYASSQLTWRKARKHRTTSP